MGELKWDPAIFGYTVGAENTDLSFDSRDSALLPKCVVVDPNFDWARERQWHPVPGTGRSSTRPTCAAIPSCTPGCRNTSAARIAAWR